MTQGTTYRTTAHRVATVQPASLPARPARTSLRQRLRRLFRFGRTEDLPATLTNDVDPDLRAASTELTSARLRLDGHLRPSIY
jgi:hypothetical protein